eukprot:m51a1_g12604 putative centrosomal protein of 41 kda isoform x1 (141) ;mRNA; f:223-3290
MLDILNFKKSQPKTALVLDARDRDEYEAGYVMCAVSYPKSTLSRVNPVTAELVALRDRETALVAVYHADDYVAGLTANGLFERGFHNVAILAGGLHAFVGAHAGLFVGKLEAKSAAPQVPQTLTPAEEYARRNIVRRGAR